jgi:hypothetical protein
LWLLKKENSFVAENERASLKFELDHKRGSLQFKCHEVIVKWI